MTPAVGAGLVAFWDCGGVGLPHPGGGLETPADAAFVCGAELLEGLPQPGGGFATPAGGSLLEGVPQPGGGFATPAGGPFGIVSGICSGGFGLGHGICALGAGAAASGAAKVEVGAFGVGFDNEGGAYCCCNA